MKAEIQPSRRIFLSLLPAVTAGLAAPAVSAAIGPIHHVAIIVRSIDFKSFAERAGRLGAADSFGATGCADVDVMLRNVSLDVVSIVSAAVVCYGRSDGWGRPADGPIAHLDPGGPATPYSASLTTSRSMCSVPALVRREVRDGSVHVAIVVVHERAAHARQDLDEERVAGEPRCPNGPPRDEGSWACRGHLGLRLGRRPPRGPRASATCCRSRRCLTRIPRPRRRPPSRSAGCRDRASPP